MLAALALIAPLQSTGHRGTLAAGLTPGMRLVYQSEGEVQPPWHVDSVRRGEALREGSECAVVHLRRRPDAPETEESRLCLAHDTLYAWEAKRQDWSIQRPVGPGMTWTSQRDNGDQVRYETGQTGQETISGHPVAVVHTTVTTSDSAAAQAPASRALRARAHHRHRWRVRVGGLHGGVAGAAALRASRDPACSLTATHCPASIRRACIHPHHPLSGARVRALLLPVCITGLYRLPLEEALGRR